DWHNGVNIIAGWRLRLIRPTNDRRASVGRASEAPPVRRWGVRRVLFRSGRANITLQAYPVSTTGETPAEGAFTALASLRVDFD
ncbi:hypothetical protein MJN51_30530, partial [Salmonella enterica subsp. enterica serovar Kentucky]|nr:hypothetical protein [Salmonella enterica subsp. enterica serovar Kentucky]